MGQTILYRTMSTHYFREAAAGVGPGPSTDHHRILGSLSHDTMAPLPRAARSVRFVTCLSRRRVSAERARCHTFNHRKLDSDRKHVLKSTGVSWYA